MGMLKIGPFSYPSYHISSISLLKFLGLGPIPKIKKIENNIMGLQGLCLALWVFNFLWPFDKMGITVAM